jgi:uncharacterized protein YqjF (DUF2071 family)
MGTENAAAAFAAAFNNNDCEELIASVEAWANKDYRTPDSVLEVVPCVQSGMHAFFARKEDECRRAWKTAEAKAWQEARATFDAGMRAFVKAIAVQPNRLRERATAPGDRRGLGQGCAAERATAPFHG